MAALIQQVLEAPGIYVFGELLEMPNVKEVLTQFSTIAEMRLAIRILLSVDVFHFSWLAVPSPSSWIYSTTLPTALTAGTKVLHFLSNVRHTLMLFCVEEAV